MCLAQGHNTMTPVGYTNRSRHLRVERKKSEIFGVEINICYIIMFVYTVVLKLSSQHWAPVDHPWAGALNPISNPVRINIDWGLVLSGTAFRETSRPVVNP